MSPVERSSFEPKTTLPALPPAPRSESSRGLLVGYQVGRYQLVEKLGGGVMATVYRAEANASGEPVAIKVLLPDADATLSVSVFSRRHTRTASSATQILCQFLTKATTPPALSPIWSCP
jgi:serine/threonine protein kinase